MPQDIQMDSFAPGWSFLSELEAGPSCLCKVIGARGFWCIWEEQESTETIEKHVWHWLCAMAVKAELGTVPALQIKWMTGFTADGPGGFSVHVYGVERAI